VIPGQGVLVRKQPLCSEGVVSVVGLTFTINSLAGTLMTDEKGSGFPRVRALINP